MKPGTQIAYIPSHANGNIWHEDVEFGFVTSEGKGVHFCRYWKKRFIGTILRTKANSEATPNEFLREYNAVPQFVIEEILKEIEEEKKGE